jgi:hypothetical protein
MQLLPRYVCTSTYSSVAAGAPLAIGLHHSKGCGRQDAEGALFLAAFFGGIGGGAGAAIGAVIRPERVLYAAPSPSAHVFSLRVAPDVIGLRAQLRF